MYLSFAFEIMDSKFKKVDDVLVLNNLVSYNLFNLSSLPNLNKGSVWTLYLV